MTARSEVEAAAALDAQQREETRARMAAFRRDVRAYAKASQQGAPESSAPLLGPVVTKSANVTKTEHIRSAWGKALARSADRHAVQEPPAGEPAAVAKPSAASQKTWNKALKRSPKPKASASADDPRLASYTKTFGRGPFG